MSTKELSTLDDVADEDVYDAAADAAYSLALDEIDRRVEARFTVEISDTTATDEQKFIATTIDNAIQSLAFDIEAEVQGGRNTALALDALEIAQKLVHLAIFTDGLRDA